MILKKALSLIAAIAAMAAAAAVCVVAAAYALYALIRYYLGPAGASAVVAIAAAVLLGVLAFILLRKAHPKPPKKGEERDLATRVIELARDKPIIAAGAAVAAGLVLIRNPKVVSTLVTAVIAARAQRPERDEIEIKRKRR